MSDTELTADTIVCTKCKTKKPIEEFYKKLKTKTGYSSVCIKCKLEYNRNYYSKNIIKIRNAHRKYMEKCRSDIEYKIKFRNYMREYRKIYYHKNIKNKKYHQSYYKYKKFLKIHNTRLKWCPNCETWYPAHTNYFCQQRGSNDGFFEICCNCSKSKKKLHQYAVMRSSNELCEQINEINH